MKMRLVTWYGIIIVAGLYGLHKLRK